MERSPFFIFSSCHGWIKVWRVPQEKLLMQHVVWLMNKHSGIAEIVQIVTSLAALLHAACQKILKSWKCFKLVQSIMNRFGVSTMGKKMIGVCLIIICCVLAFCTGLCPFQQLPAQLYHWLNEDNQTVRLWVYSQMFYTPLFASTKQEPRFSVSDLCAVL